MSRRLARNPEGETSAYLEQFPELSRWIAGCNVYGARGHHPGMPDIITGSCGVPLPTGCEVRRMFPNVMDRDDLGRSADCTRLM